MRAHPEEIQELARRAPCPWDDEFAQGVAIKPDWKRKAMPDDFAIVRTKQAESSPEKLEIYWLSRAAGYGSLTFTKRTDGRLDCENEGMTKSFCLGVLSFFGWAQMGAGAQLPALWVEFGGHHGLLTAAVPKEGGGDWGKRDQPV
jgi:hypothetical protein